jgi:lysophospholipase L1-like esterase
MKKLPRILKIIFWISIAINLLFLVLIFSYYLRNKDQIKQKVILARGNPEIIMFGDSHTANAKWTELLPGKKVITIGFNGYTSDQLRNMLMLKVLPLKPEICFIQAGGNDINSRCFGKSILTSNIQTMTDSLNKNNIRPVIQSLFNRTNSPEYNQQVDSINVLLRELALKKNIAFLDINSRLIDKDGLKNEFTIDNIHLNQKGYTIWSEIVEEYLVSGQK